MPVFDLPPRDAAMFRRSLLLAFLLAPLARAEDYPFKEIESNKLKAKVYTPDAKTGFYRGTRFDWSGVFNVEFDGHKFFGPWKEKHDPANNDDIVGPVEEFAPLGFDEAKTGERFLKPGVGWLEKDKNAKYQFWTNFKILEAGTWTTTPFKNHVKFEHEIKPEGGYGYKYTKIVTLIGHRVTIQHSLENTGTKAIATNQYNHNFFNVDGEPTAKGDSIQFAFTPKPKAEKNQLDPFAKLDGQTLTLGESISKGSIYAEFTGFDPKEKSEAGFTYKHAKSGIAVKVWSDRPLSDCRVWGMKTTLCPEPYLAVTVDPGKKMLWMWAYEFSK